MKTTTEQAAEIRAAYKALGWNSRKISVRTDYYSMGSSIHVEVKSPEVDARKAEEIAMGAEHIHRCQITGDILSGGNTYVHFGHSRECREILARRWQDQLTAALDRIPEGDHSRLELIDGADGARVGRSDPSTAQLWVNDRMACQFWARDAGGIQGGAFQLARLLDSRA